MSLSIVCGKQRTVGTDEGRMKTMNWHSEDIWGNRKHSGSEYGLWGQTVQAHIPAPPSSDELSLAVREGNLSQLHLYNEDDSQIEKDKYQMITYKWNLKKKKKIHRNSRRMYLQNRNRPTDIENKLMVTKGESEGEG